MSQVTGTGVMADVGPAMAVTRPSAVVPVLLPLDGEVLTLPNKRTAEWVGVA